MPSHEFVGTAHVDTEDVWVIEDYDGRNIIVPRELTDGLVDYGWHLPLYREYRCLYRLPNPGETPDYWRIKCYGIVLEIIGYEIKRNDKIKTRLRAVNKPL